MKSKVSILDTDFAGEGENERDAKRESGHSCGSQPGGKCNDCKCGADKETKTATELEDAERLFRAIARMHSQVITLRGRTRLEGKEIKRH